MRIEVYEDEGGKWRWRLRAGSKAKFGVSGESFASKSNAKRAGRRMAELMVDHPPVVVVES